MNQTIIEGAFEAVTSITNIITMLKNEVVALNATVKEQEEKIAKLEVESVKNSN